MWQSFLEHFAVGTCTYLHIELYVVFLLVYLFEEHVVHKQNVSTLEVPPSVYDIFF